MQETPHPPHRSEVPSVGCSHVLWRTKYLGQVNLLCVFSSPTPVDSKSSWIFWAQIFSLTSWSKKDLGQKIFVRDWTGTLHYFGAFLTPPPPLHFPFQSDTSTTYKIKQLPNRPPLSTKGENCLEDDFKRYLSHFLSFSLSLHRHEFHKKCVDPWLKLKRTCPICKQNITNDNRRRMAAGSTSSISSVSSGTTQESSLQEEEEVQSMEQQQSVQVAVDIDQESVSVPNTMAFVWSNFSAAFCYIS